MTVNTLGSDERAAKPRNAAWLWPLLPVAVSMFALSALVTYQLHANGDQLAQSVLQRAVVGIYRFFGFVPAFFFFLLVLSWSSIWFVTGRLEKPGTRVLRLLALTLALAIWVNLQPAGSEASPAAGALGNWIGGRMVTTLGRFLSVLVVAPLALAALLLATDFFFYRFFEGVHARLDELGPDQLGAEAAEGVEPDVSEHFKGLSQVLAPNPARETAPPGSAAAAARAVASPRSVDPVVGDPAVVARPVVIPAVAPPAAAPDPAPAGRRESHFERRQREEREGGPSPTVFGPTVFGPTVFGPTGFENAKVEPAEVEPGEVGTGEIGIGEPEAGELEAGAPGPAAATSPPADDEFSIAAALTEQAATDEPPVPPSVPAELERAADLGAGAAGGGVVRPWGAAVVDDDDDDDEEVNDDEDDLDEVDADEAAEAAAIDGLDGDAIVVLEPNADLVSAGPDAAPDAEVQAIGSRIEPDEARGDEVPVRDADEAPIAKAAGNAKGETEDEAGDGPGADAEPVVAIPRPAEGVRQQRLFVTTVDEALVREAVELVTSTRRASVALLQRKLQIDFEQAMEVLAVLARRGVIDLTAGETQGRVR
jgi:hypothetical protein